MLLRVSLSLDPPTDLIDRFSGLWSALWIMRSGWGVQMLLVCPALPLWCLRSGLVGWCSSWSDGAWWGVGGGE